MMIDVGGGLLADYRGGGWYFLDDVGIDCVGSATRGGLWCAAVMVAVGVVLVAGGDIYIYIYIAACWYFNVIAVMTDVGRGWQQ